MLGRNKGEKQWYENRAPGAKAGGGGFNAFVWRSIKKIFLSGVLLVILGLRDFVSNLNLVFTGQADIIAAIASSFVAALHNGYVDFIPRVIGFFTSLAGGLPADALVYNLIPNVVVYLFTFLWVSFVADILDQRKYEAFSFAFVSIITLIVVVIFAISGYGISSMMTLLGGL